MSVDRIFLDNQQPAIPSAVRYLFQRYTAQGGGVDLQKVTVVVPASRAATRLRELCVTTAEQQDVEFWPPEIVTVGRLPELLYRPKLRLASTLVQNIAWANALKRMDSSIVRQVIPHVPSGDDRPWRDAEWLEYGTMVCAQYRALAAEGLTFADVADQTVRIGSGDESRRWNALATIQETYLSLLDSAELWDRQTARVVAVRNQEVDTDSEIVLLGTVDVNRIVRQMIQQIPEQVTALIHAPDEWQDHFDEFGCVVPEIWQSQRLQVPDQVIVHVNDPEEQAAAVGQILHTYDGEFAPQEISIGVPDAQLVPFIQRCLSQRGVATLWSGGSAIGESSAYLLLAAVADYLETSSARATAALVRHPCVAEQVAGRVNQPSDWIVRLDEAFQEHLPMRLSADSADSIDSEILRQFSHMLPKLLGELVDIPPKNAGDAGRPQPSGRETEPHVHERPLPQWAAPIEAFLLACYSNRLFDRTVAADIAAYEAAVKVQQSLQEIASLPDSVAPTVTAAEAVRYVLADVESESLSDGAPPDAVELLGWLDLPLDDAPALIVTSFHERFVPQSITSDLFLPNSLREQLGIDDNRRRYARDAYALSTLLHSRKNVHIIVARRNVDGDPELPSRLLLAEADQRLADRCLRFFDDNAPRDSIFQSADAATEPPKDLAEVSRFSVPHPSSFEYAPIQRLSPTRFRDYIDCPYRFFLRHVLRLAPVEADLAQMDGRGFGNLMHRVLETFGRQVALRDCSEDDTIFDFLSRQLDQQSKRQFGAAPSPAVRVQIETMRFRLKAFSQHQARRVSEGWRTIFVEETVEFVYPNTSMTIRGMVDRIDTNENGDWAVFDYKSGDQGSNPEQVHRKKKSEWIDLQLPLYRHLAQELATRSEAPKSSGTIQLGYVLLPSDLKKVGFHQADWSEADLESADARAMEIIRQIEDNVFWPPAIVPPLYSEWAAPICLDTVLTPAPAS